MEWQSIMAAGFSAIGFSYFDICSATGQRGWGVLRSGAFWNYVGLQVFLAVLGYFVFGFNGGRFAELPKFLQGAVIALASGFIIRQFAQGFYKDTPLTPSEWLTNLRQHAIDEVTQKAAKAESRQRIAAASRLARHDLAVLKRAIALSYHEHPQDETFEEFEQAAEDNPEIYTQRLVRLWGPVEAERIVEESVSRGT